MGGAGTAFSATSAAEEGTATGHLTTSLGGANVGACGAVEVPGVGVPTAVIGMESALAATPDPPEVS